MSICAQFLSSSRAVARKNKSWTDTACAVLGDSGYYFVESNDGDIVWEGSAHCKYCARAEAIAKMADKVAA